MTYSQCPQVGEKKSTARTAGDWARRGRAGEGRGQHQSGRADGHGRPAPKPHRRTAQMSGRVR